MINSLILVMASLILALLLWIVCNCAGATLIRVNMRKGFDQMSSMLAMQTLVGVFGAYAIIDAILKVIGVK